jgi:hypothetical protein
LIFKTQEYTYSGLYALARDLKQNLKNAGITVKGKKRFCTYASVRNKENNPLSPTEVVGTEFFHNMVQNKKSNHHQRALEFIVPCQLETVERNLPQSTQLATPEVKDWYARIVTCLMTDEQLEKHCNVQAQVNPEINQLRGEIAGELVQSCKAGTTTAHDLDLIIEICRLAINQMAHADHVDTSLNFAGRYLTLFGKGGANALTLGDDVLGLLATRFKERTFPKPDSPGE